MPPQLKPLSTLPHSKVSYRIDMLGDIQRNPASSTNHLINILVSPVTPGHDYSKIFEPEAVNSNEQECYQISAGELFLFSPGCVVRNRTRVWVPQLPTISESINVSESNVKFVTPANGLYSVIPYGSYKLGIASRSTFVAIEQDGDPYSIIIPTMEILRFYYSGSSKLNQAIFSSKLTDLNSVLNLDKCFFEEKSQTLTVCLRQDYPDDDAAMLGHWYLDERAHKQVLNVWNALIKFTQLQKFNYLPLEIGFPFVGTTLLQGQGVELPTPEGIAKKRKLILTLIKCSHPRPFKKLIHTRDNEGGAGINDTPDQKPRPTVGYHQRIVVHSNQAKPDEAEDEGVNDPFANPSLDIEPKLIRVSAHRFPKIEIENRAKEQSTHKSSLGAPETDDNLPNQSTSDPAAGKNGIVRIVIVPTENTDESDKKKTRDIESLPVTFKTFKKVIEALKKLKTIRAATEILIDPAITKDGQHISQFPSEFTNHNAIKWSTVIEDGEARPRLAMIVKIKAEHGIHYLLEVERKERRDSDGKIKFDREYATYVFSCKSTCQEIKEEKIKALLTSLAESAFEEHTKKFSDSGFIVKSIRHQSSVVERAKRIETSTISLWTEAKFPHKKSTTSS